MNQLSYAISGLTSQEADLLLAGLGELPMKFSEPLVNKLRGQFHAQSQAFMEAQQAQQKETPPAA